MTVQTPMTMPTIVRKARSLCARSALRAKRRFSPRKSPHLVENAPDHSNLSASIGVRRLALIAGKTPATRPVSVCEDESRDDEAGETSVGSGLNASTQSAMTQPRTTPTIPPRGRGVRPRAGTGRGRRACAPDGETEANLLGPLDHRDEHDVRDHDRADHEGDAADEDEERERGRRDRLPDDLDGVGVHERDGVGSFGSVCRRARKIARISS